MIAIALAGGLSACELWQDDTLARPAPQPARVVARPAVAPVVLPKPPPPATEARVALKAPKPQARPFRIEPYAPIKSAWAIEPFGPRPPVAVEPVNVVGLSEDETVGLLGEPESRAWRPPSRVLRYASNGCAVDIYFYLDVAKDKFQALQLKAPNAVSDEATLQTCLGKVRDEHRTR